MVGTLLFPLKKIGKQFLNQVVILANIGRTFSDTNRTRSDLTEPDPEGYPIFLQAKSGARITVSSITGSKRYLNDTPIVSDNNHPNSIVYDTDEAFVIDDMDTHGNWSDQGTPTLNISADSTSGHYWVGDNGTKVAWTDTSGTAVIQSTQSYGDFSEATGETSGTPSQGTIGLWVYIDDASAQTDFVLKIGSSASDYAVYSAGFYADLTEFEDETRFLLQFNLDDPDSVTGTPDWTSVDWVRVEWSLSAAGFVVFDYFTVSKSNDISLCGTDERKTTIEVFEESF
jgi:hypothetical protein